MSITGAARCINLDHTGAVILAALIDGDGTVESAIATLVDRYSIDEARPRADITALVHSLCACGLVISR
jgi:hypothetical protein